MSEPKTSRMVTPERRSDDVGDTALRPQSLSDFVGQQQARKNLSVFIEAARKRGEALDHVLFVGPPGLGKTTLAQIVAVRHPKPGEKGQTIAVVSPCGSCREIIHDYDAKARVIVPNGGDGAVATIAELLPNKYVRGSGRW